MGGVYKELAAKQAFAQEDSRKHPMSPSSRSNQVQHGGGTQRFRQRRRQQRGGYHAEGSADTLEQSRLLNNSQDDIADLEIFQQSCQFFGMDSPEDLDEAQLPRILPLLVSKIVKLALSPKGSRFLQRVMELIKKKQDLVNLVEELKGNVISALESPHANHVLQKAIFLLPPCRIDFIAQELLLFKDGPAGLARHQYGCRVLERLIEHFPVDKLQPFIDGVLMDGKALCRNHYGNFVLQHLAEHSKPACKQVVELCLDPVNDLPSLALNQHACGVVDAALTYGEPSDQCRLAEELLRTPDVFSQMCRDKHRGGTEIVKHLFRMEKPDINQRARAELQKRAPELLQTKQGKLLLQACLPDQFAKDVPK